MKLATTAPVNPRLSLLGVLTAAAACAPAGLAQGPAEARALPRTASVGRLEVVATFDGPTPSGVTVSRGGRVFVTFPRWGDPVEFTVAEVKNGRAVAFPDAAVNRPDKDHPADCFLSAQTVIVDALDRLWVLDTGLIQFAPAGYGGPKLVCVDLRRNRIDRKILFPQDVALATTYLNDVRFDLRRGEKGMAYITDSSDNGPPGIIVVDLASGRSWRRLSDHPSTRAEKDFLPFVEGRPFLDRPVNGPPKQVKFGADGIAISHDGKRLYYCAVASRRLYSVSTDALADAKLPETEVAKTVIDHGEKGASDGMESDAEGRLYVTNYEQNAVHRRLPNGQLETVVADPRLLWPDTICLADERYAKMLEYTFDTIVARFPDYDYSPFVQERFHADWSPDRAYQWQQDRAVVGHNLKIAWNLMRFHSHKPKKEYVALARRIADTMPAVGSDRLRGGWYDVMERRKVEGEDAYRFAFHDRKAWWQQEQAILAYYILAGVLGDKDYLRLARESAAFYNTFFLDHDDGAIYFNVLANGIPYLVGNERFKGSHSMSGYHSFELCYLSQVYLNLLLFRHPPDLHFKPLPGAFRRNLLRVEPDILPPGRIRLSEVWVNDEPYRHFDAVTLPETRERPRVRARVEGRG